MNTNHDGATKAPLDGGVVGSEVTQSDVSVIVFTGRNNRVLGHAANQLPHMNTKHPTAKTVPTPPLVSAAEINEANYTRARFDKGLAWTVKDIGQRRAPNRRSTWSHQIGVAGELTVASYLETKLDHTITPDYAGDRGYDLQYGDWKIEVKTVTNDDDAQLKIPQHQAEAVDYVALARCSNPSELVQLIGWAPSDYLAAFGYRFPGDDLIRLDANRLLPFEPIYLSPDRIRDSQQL